MYVFQKEVTHDILNLFRSQFHRSKYKQTCELAVSTNV